MTKTRRQFVAASLGVLAFCASGLAQAFSPDRPTVLELFTSQGCSSCPPADRVLTQLSQQEGVIALSYHVDYWDYIGWKDEHALPISTERQRAYAQRMNLRYVYTPQMVIDGVEQAVGSKLGDIHNCVAAVEELPRAELSADGQTLNVVVPKSLAGDAGPIRPLDVVLVTFRPWSESRVTRGENQGHSLGYTNSVLSHSVLGRVLANSKEFPLPKVSHPGAVVLLQEPGHGPIHGALRLK